MDREALLVECGCLYRPDRLLNAQADEIGGRDIAGAHGAGAAVDVLAVIKEGGRAFPVAVKVQLHLGAEYFAQAVGMAGAFLQHVWRSVRIDAHDAQDRAPGNKLTAEPAEMPGRKVRIAASRHFPSLTRLGCSLTT